MLNDMHSNPNKHIVKNIESNRLHQIENIM